MEENEGRKRLFVPASVAGTSRRSLISGERASILAASRLLPRTALDAAFSSNQSSAVPSRFRRLSSALPPRHRTSPATRTQPPHALGTSAPFVCPPPTTSDVTSNRHAGVPPPSALRRLSSALPARDRTRPPTSAQASALPWHFGAVRSLSPHGIARGPTSTWEFASARRDRMLALGSARPGFRKSRTAATFPLTLTCSVKSCSNDSFNSSASRAPLAVSERYARATGFGLPASTSSVGRTPTLGHTSHASLVDPGSSVTRQDASKLHLPMIGASTSATDPGLSTNDVLVLLRFRTARARRITVPASR